MGQRGMAALVVASFVVLAGGCTGPGEGPHPDNSPGASGDAVARHVAYLQSVQSNVRPEFHVALPGPALPGDDARSSRPVVHNPTQKLRGTFDAARVEVTSLQNPDAADATPWRWALEVERVGADALVQAPTLLGTDVTDNRVEHRRALASGATFVEWYRNGPLGIQQGFVFDAPPSEAPKDELVVHLRVDGDLTLARHDAQSATFADADGRPALRYGELYAWDATGRFLPVRLDAGPGAHLALRVDDREAVYPVTIDPVISGATRTVTNLADAGPGSLRQAMADALDGETVVFDASVQGRIVLTSGPLQFRIGSPPAITRFAIEGPGADVVTVDGNGAGLVIDAAGQSSFYRHVTISGLTITNGNSPSGGGIASGGRLVIDRCYIHGNQAIDSNGSGQGGAVRASDELVITNSTISDNQAGSDGGGVWSWGNTTITNSTISGNHAGRNGGGIHVGNGRSLHLDHVTVVHNTAEGRGGGTDSTSELRINNSILENDAPLGPDIYSSSTNVRIGTTLIGNTRGLQYSNFGGNLHDVPAFLAALAPNGSPVPTHRPIACSPVIDAAADATTLTEDQRGEPRVHGARADMGAFEHQGDGPPCERVTTTADAGAGSLRAAIEAANALGDTQGIVFEIPGDAPHTIALQSALPALTHPIFIDGYSQPGARPNESFSDFDAVVGAAVDGGGTLPVGIGIGAGRSWVRGLALHGFTDADVHVAGGDRNLVTGNILGARADRSLPATAPGAVGVLLGASGQTDGNLIGGRPLAWRNLIAHHSQAGVRGQDTRLATIEGNGYFANSGQAIDIEATFAAGLTPPPRPEVLSAQLRNGQLVLTYRLPASPDDWEYPARLEVYLTDTAGEGRWLLLREEVPRFMSEVERTETFTTPWPVALGDHVVAAVTYAGGHSSEFTTPVEIEAFTLPSFVVVNPHSDGPGSLSAAIDAANAGIGGHITFDIPEDEFGPGPHTIELLQSPFYIDNPMVIDGFTQPGASANTDPFGNDARVMIELDGGGDAWSGFDLYRADNVTIRGLALHGFESEAIVVWESEDFRLEGNRIGLTATGAPSPHPQAVFGVVAVGSSGTVGGTLPEHKNVIANAHVGVGVTNGESFAILGNSFHDNEHAAIALLTITPPDGDEGPGGPTGPDGAGEPGVQPLDNTPFDNAPFDDNGPGLPPIPPNDPHDADGGANRAQNFPELSRARLTDAGVELGYRVPSAPEHATYPLRVEFYVADTERQGRYYLGSHSYAEADAEQAVVATLVPAGVVRAGDRVVATATDADGNTSHFSEEIVVEAGLSAAHSTIEATPDTLLADGLGTSEIRVQLVDPSGDRFALEGAEVVITTTDGTLEGAVEDLGGGLYGQTLRAATAVGTAEIRATVDGTPLDARAEVRFVASTPLNTTPPRFEGMPDGQPDYAFDPCSRVVVTAGEWAGVPAPQLSYQWQRCDLDGEDCVDIEGATEAEYITGADDVGHTVQVLVTAGNDAGEATMTVGPTPVAPGPLPECVIEAVAAGPGGYVVTGTAHTEGACPIERVAFDVDGRVLEADSLDAQTGEWTLTVELTAQTTAVLTCQAYDAGGQPGPGYEVTIETGACWEVGPCDAETRLCSTPLTDEAIVCNSDTVCGGTCQAGACVGGEAIACDDGNPCTVGVCDLEAGGCRFEPVVDGTTCGAEAACAAAPTCQAGACVEGAPIDECPGEHPGPGEDPDDALDTYVVSGNGFCAVSSLSGGPGGARSKGPFALVALLLGALAVRRRRGGRAAVATIAVAALAAAATLVAPAPLHAQGALTGGLPLQNFEPVPGVHNMAVVSGASTLDTGRFALGMSVNYGHRPLSIRSERTGDGVDLVRNHLQADLLASVGLWERIELGLGVPVTMYQSGAQAPGLPGRELAAWGLGDLRLYPKWHVLGETGAARSAASGYGDGGFGLALMAVTTLPTGNGEDFAGNGAVTVEPRVVAEYAFASGARLAANLGYVVRPEQAVLDFRVGNELTYRLGYEQPLVAGAASDSALSMTAELFGASGLDADVSPTLEHNPLELLVSARLRLADAHHFSAGAGPGLTTGYGAPVWRAYLGYTFAYAPAPSPLETAPLETAPVVHHVEPEPEPEPAVEAEPEPEPEPVVAEVAPEPEPVVCPEITVGSGVFDEDGCELEQEERAYIEKERITIHQQIFFGYDEATLLSESHGILRQVAGVLAEHPDVRRLEIQGHTDHVGGPSYNLELSQRRADAVRDFLVQQGVAPERLVSKGYGLSAPRAVNDTDEGRARNRRVEFVILERDE